MSIDTTCNHWNKQQTATFIYFIFYINIDSPASLAVYYEKSACQHAILNIHTRSYVIS